MSCGADSDDDGRATPPLPAAPSAPAAQLKSSGTEPSTEEQQRKAEKRKQLQQVEERCEQLQSTAGRDGGSGSSPNVATFSGGVRLRVRGLATLPLVIDTAEHLLSKGPAGAGVPWSVARCRSSRFCAAR